MLLLAFCPVCLFLYLKNIFEKIKIFLFFFLLQFNIFLLFLDHFNKLISKIIFKK
jgi:hypothetical protein